jgi:phage FluMu protein Com
VPIRFRCKRCHQLLGIASRKAGGQIACPKCGVLLVVPTQEAADAAMAMDKTGGAVPANDPSNYIVYDDEPAAIETPRARQTAQSSQAGTSQAAPAQGIAGTAGVQPSAAPVEGRPVPRGMILFPRRSYYTQGLLFPLFAAVAFAAGYYIGRGDATYELKVQAETKAKETILLEGKVVYNPGTGEIAGDRNAVIIVLPETKELDPKLDIRDIRVTDPPPSRNHKTVRRIEEMGGGYARANLQGEFSILLPDQGKYCLLIVSRNASRPANRAPGEFDLVQIEKYFTLPEHLIEQFKYRWETLEINKGTDLIEQDFGRDGTE